MALTMAQPSFLAASLTVALGGAIGAWLRFLSGYATVALLGPARAGAFPWSTLFCNVAGSLAMGLLIGWLARHSGASGEALRLFLAVGVLGGFTTFSAFSMEIVLLAQRGQPGLAALYASLSLAAGIAGLLLGLALMRQPA
jgi:fluoride exporter